jgi:hypothetical protein
VSSPLEAIGRFALERPQRLDLFLDRGANALRVAAARGRLDLAGQQNRNRQRDAGECCGDPAPLPINRTAILDGNHDARSQGRHDGP